MSTTPEYKEMMTSMSKINSMERELKKMDSENAKFGELNKALQETFDTPEIREAASQSSKQESKKI